VADALVKHLLRQNPEAGLSGDTIIPIVSECDDSYLNDARGLHVHEEHVRTALDSAGEVVDEGAVGAGTGMTCYDFKGGIGTSSRIVKAHSAEHVLGSIVLSNHGVRDELLVEGVPVGRLVDAPNPRRQEHGSIVMIVGTDAPLDARQLGRIAKRAAMGLAKTGSCAHNGSGDIVLAFSTANVHDRYNHNGLVTEHLLLDRDLDSFFRATVDSVEESIINSIFKAETTDGRDGHVSPELPIEPVVEILKARRMDQKVA